MIYWLLLIDIIVGNYTKYTSYFFISYLYNKSYKHYLLVGLILDYIIFNTYFYNIIILTAMYFLNKLLNDLNKDNFYNYIFINMYNYLLYIVLSNLLLFNNLDYIFISIGSNLIINIIFYILSYRLINKEILK